jgi:hypothetical protein
MNNDKYESLMNTFNVLMNFSPAFKGFFDIVADKTAEEREQSKEEEFEKTNTEYFTGE